MVYNYRALQRYQTLPIQTLRAITKAPLYVSNQSFHNDLAIPLVKDVTKSFYKRFNLNLQNHTNPLIKSLDFANIPGNPQKSIKRQWCRDLLT